MWGAEAISRNEGQVLRLHMRVSFGEFVMDFDERRLFARTREVRLTPKGFDLLRLLIEHRPKA